MKAYYGYITDDATLINCSSGGFATSIMKDAIMNGGIVYGSAYDLNFYGATIIRVRDIESISRLQGAKYVKSRIAGIFETVANDLVSGGHVFYFGLPCEVYAVKHYLEKKSIDMSKLITIDLICHGPTCNSALKQFCERLEKKYKSSVAFLNMRYKRNGMWSPAYVWVKFKNGKEYCEELARSDIGMAFFNMPNPSCLQCKFKSANHCADITLGDYWGISKSDDGFNPAGVSLCLVHSNIGENYLLSLKDIALYETNPNEALMNNPMYSSIPKFDNNAIMQFRENFKHHGLHYACLQKMTLKQKVIRCTSLRLRDVIVRAKSSIRKQEVRK